MRVKFRLSLDTKGNRVTRIYFVNSDDSLELVTQLSGWVGLDFDSMGNDEVDKVASAIADKTDNSKYIE